MQDEINMLCLKKAGIVKCVFVFLFALNFFIIEYIVSSPPMVVQEYGSVHDVDTVGEEMGGVTDDDDAVAKRGKKKGKSGLKPGQALSFTGLEKRSHTGV
jgi:hypothetical protein